ncbi:hypothetical protein V2G26_009566 [Clonostachys chloroleuca]
MPPSTNPTHQESISGGPHWLSCYVPYAPRFQRSLGGSAAFVRDRRSPSTLHTTSPAEQEWEGRDREAGREASGLIFSAMPPIRPGLAPIFTNANVVWQVLCNCRVMDNGRSEAEVKPT